MTDLNELLERGITRVAEGDSRLVRIGQEIERRARQNK